ncbi:MAG: aldo/keto reductase [Phycisphaerae bacterium]|nr:aldo/keto reductase [Phycisphaerae bacterium]
MERRRLGNSGMEVSAIGLGTWAMGGAVESWGHVDDRESIAAIHEALECGINLIDTAPIYGLGHSEEIVGKATLGRRKDVFLATKCGLLFPRNREDVPERCLTKDSILRECDASLRRLRTDVIDLYQCHWPDPKTPIRETMEAMVSLLHLGKIRAIGVSNFSLEQIAAAREFGPVHSLQPPFSMLHLHAANDLLPFCKEHDIGVLAYSPLAKGLLSGRFSPETPLSGIRSRDPEFLGSRFRGNLLLVEKLKVIAGRYDRTVTQLVLNWTAYHDGVTAPIVGAKLASQVSEASQSIGWKLREEDRAEIDRLVRENGHGI